MDLGELLHDLYRETLAGVDTTTELDERITAALSEGITPVLPT